MVQTINHRRLVGEVYDKGVLHHILGIKPKAKVVTKELYGELHQNKRLKSLPTRSENKYSPWKDMGGDTSMTHDMCDLSHSNDHDPEESGRYDIRKQLPKKRRRKGREEDKHTVFIVDDEDGNGSDPRSMDVAEAKEYAINDELRLGQSKSSADTHTKRSYWLSKAQGLGEDRSGSE